VLCATSSSVLITNLKSKRALFTPKIGSRSSFFFTRDPIIESSSRADYLARYFTSAKCLVLGINMNISFESATDENWEGNRKQSKKMKIGQFGNESLSICLSPRRCDDGFGEEASEARTSRCVGTVIDGKLRKSSINDRSTIRSSLRALADHLLRKTFSNVVIRSGAISN
jgi:hypothetical protein